MPFDLQPTLKSDILELRPLRSDDFEQLYAVASDPLLWEQHPNSDRYQLDVFRKFFDEAMQSGGALIALDRKNNHVIGSSRFHCYDVVRSEIEIGWTFLARSHWGGRYNGDMKRLMLAHAFQFVNNVIFFVGSTNLRSQRAVEKIGGVRAGTKIDPHGRESFIFRITRAIFDSMNQTTGVTVRRATLDDANLLAELGARTFYETFAADNTVADMDAYLASNFSPTQQTAELVDPAATFLIAEIGGIAAGYAKLHTGAPAEGIEGAKPIELVRLYVASQWLGRGVGQILMRACLDEAQRVGHKTIWLGVWERNARAQAFYRKWDFRPVGEHMFLLGSDQQRDILMERAI